MKTMSFIQELIDGIKTEKPDRFKKLQKIALYLTFVFLVITYLPEILSYFEITYVIPEKIIIISEKLYQAFILLFGFSYLPKKDNINESTKEGDPELPIENK